MNSRLGRLIQGFILFHLLALMMQVNVYADTSNLLYDGKLVRVSFFSSTLAKKKEGGQLAKKLKKEWGSQYFSGDKKRIFKIEVKPDRWSEVCTNDVGGPFISQLVTKGSVKFNISTLRPKKELVYSLGPVPFNINKIFHGRCHLKNKRIFERKEMNNQVFTRASKVFSLLVEQAVGKKVSDQLIIAKKSLSHQYEGERVGMQRAGNIYVSVVKGVGSAAMSGLKVLGSAEMAGFSQGLASSSSYSGRQQSGMEMLAQHNKEMRNSYNKSAVALRNERTASDRKNIQTLLNRPTPKPRYMNSQYSASTAISKKERRAASIRRQKAACDAKGGRYSERTQNCTIYRQMNTVVVKDLGVNRMSSNSSGDSSSKTRASSENSSSNGRSDNGSYGSDRSSGVNDVSEQGPSTVGSMEAHAVCWSWITTRTKKERWRCVGPTQLTTIEKSEAAALKYSGCRTYRKKFHNVRVSRSGLKSLESGDYRGYGYACGRAWSNKGEKKELDRFNIHWPASVIFKKYQCEQNTSGEIKYYTCK